MRRGETTIPAEIIGMPICCSNTTTQNPYMLSTGRATRDQKVKIFIENFSVIDTLEMEGTKLINWTLLLCSSN